MKRFWYWLWNADSWLAVYLSVIPTVLLVVGLLFLLAELIS